MPVIEFLHVYEEKPLIHRSAVVTIQLLFGRCTSRFVVSTLAMQLADDECGRLEGASSHA